MIEPGDVCPQPTTDAYLYVSEVDGYCLLYPNDAVESPDLPGGFDIGPPLSHPDFPGLRTGLAVGTFGIAPAGTSPRDAAPGLFETGVDPATVQETTIGGYAAVTYIDYDGPFGHRSAVIVVAAGELAAVYTISMNPYDATLYPETIEIGNRLWDTVVGSLQFFTPWR